MNISDKLVKRYLSHFIVIPATMFVLLTFTVLAQAEGLVRVKGAHTLATAVGKLSESFTKEHPDCQVIVSGGGTTTGITGFLEKSVEIILAVRDLNDAEKEKAANIGLSPAKRVMANDGVAIVVHPSNPINELTVEQVVGVFSGNFTNWKQIGGPELPIEVVLISSKHGTHGFFKKNYLKGKPYVSEPTIRPEWHFIINKVSAGKAGIGLCVTNKAMQAQDKVKILAIKKDAESPAITLTREAMENGSYPIPRPAYFIWDENSSECVKKFVEYCTKKGVKIQ